MPSHRILSQVHAAASRAVSSPKDLLAIKAGRGSYSSPSVGHTSASKSIGEAIKNAKKTSPTPLTPGSPIIKRGSRGARRSSSQATDFNFSEAQVGSRYSQYGLIMPSTVMLNLITSSVIAGPSFRDELPGHEGFREEAEQVRAEAGCRCLIFQHI